MSVLKICVILLVILSGQATLSTATDSSDESIDIEDMRKNPTPKQKIYLYVMDNFSALISDCALHAYEVIEKMLKDESLLANHNAEVEEFKNNLIKFVNKYKTIKKSETKWSLVGVYNDTIEHYYDLIENKQTVATHFIVDMLNKYNARQVGMDFNRKFQMFIGNLKKMFEETKTDLDISTLEWYEKFKDIVGHDKQIDAFDSFWNLV